MEFSAGRRSAAQVRAESQNNTLCFHKRPSSINQFHLVFNLLFRPAGSSAIVPGQLIPITQNPRLTKLNIKITAKNEETQSCQYRKERKPRNTRNTRTPICFGGKGLDSSRISRVSRFKKLLGREFGHYKRVLHFFRAQVDFHHERSGNQRRGAISQPGGTR
jgi:hypothetical protein